MSFDAMPPARDALRFRFRGGEVVLRRFSPRATVLDWLREEMGAKGTKEGCAEGDCGACTVVLGERNAAGGVHFKAVNACIQFLPTLDGKALYTVEDLRQPDGSLHPVQREMAQPLALAVHGHVGLVGRVLVGLLQVGEVIAAIGAFAVRGTGCLCWWGWPEHRC